MYLIFIIKKINWFYFVWLLVIYNSCYAGFYFILTLNMVLKPSDVELARREEELRKSWDWLLPWDSLTSFSNFSSQKVKETLDLSKVRFEVYWDERKIVIFSESWELIWEMYGWEYWIWEQKFPHNWIEIKDKFRSKWFWRILFEKYKEVFWIEEIEYTRKKWTLQFLLAVWYVCDLLIDENGWDEIDIRWNDDEENVRLLKSWYSIRLIYQW